MAISENGPFGEHRGKIGNVVYYMLNGKQVARKIGRRTKPLSRLQQAQLQKVKLIGELLKKLKEFIAVGFSVEQLGTTKNAFNLAMKYNFQVLISGDYPDLQISYPNLVLSKGTLPSAQNPTVSETAEGLRFNWDTDPQMSFAQSTDQAMMLAYFPLEEKAVFILFGAARAAGTDVLWLQESLRGKYAEIYMAFISAERKQVASNSYLGNIHQGG